MTSRRYSKKLSVDDGASKGSKSYFHHRATEFAEFGIFLDYVLFTPRPLRLRGDFSRAVAFYVARFTSRNGANSTVLGTDRGSSKEGRHGHGHRSTRKRDARCAHPGFSKEVPGNQRRVNEYGRQSDRPEVTQRAYRLEIHHRRNHHRYDNSARNSRAGKSSRADQTRPHWT